MSRSVNVIKFTYDPEATLARHWSVIIDKQDLRDLLEQAATAPVSGHWANKTKALVNFDDLKRSLDNSGELELLICANCAAAGYKSCGDLDLGPFKISHEGEFVIWQVSAPNSKESAGRGRLLPFKFHQPQYFAEVKKALEKWVRLTKR